MRVADTEVCTHQDLTLPSLQPPSTMLSTLEMEKYKLHLPDSATRDPWDQGSTKQMHPIKRGRRKRHEVVPLPGETVVSL